jgi:hypothetical protein
MNRDKSFTTPLWTIIRHTSFVIAVWLISATIASAQSNVSGRVSGRVTDQSGAIIPNAQINAQNTGTNVTSGTQSDSSGYYVLQLPAGNYVISVSSAGMATLKQDNVAVTIGGDAGLDFHLQVASTRTVVEVQAEASAELITPNTPAVQLTVNNALVSTMPVEVSGTLRNADSFLRLEPGYNGTTGNGSLNGGSGSDQVTTVDGADVSGVGFGSGGQSIAYAMPVPSFAVQEFQVVGSNPDADVGRTSTGAISYQLKSGTNQFHGIVFDYNRNTIYDAKTYFEPTRGVDLENEFGFDLGGPIRRDKTFFYGYYDGYRYSTSNTGTYYSLLTPAMKAGDFSAAGIPAIYNPATTAANGQGGYSRQQFSCNGVLNVICPDQISPVSAYFASLLPNPTLPSLTNNYQGTTTSSNNSDQFLVKIDHALSPTSRLSGSYNWMRNPQISDCPFGNVVCGGSVNPFHGDRAIINWNKTISANKLNHVIVSFDLLDFYDRIGGQNSLTDGPNTNAKAGLGFVNQTGTAHLAVGGTISPTGVISTAGIYFVGGGSNINKIAHSVLRVGDDYTWEHASHQMTFGFLSLHYYTIGVQGAYGSSNFGTFEFSPLESGLPGNSATGFNVASFMLGDVDAGGLGQNPSQAMQMPYYGIYGQDKWKIRSNLTLTAGLRWDYSEPVTDRQNKIANFDPNLPNTDAANTLGALVFAGNGPGRAGKRQFANAWYWGFGPRIGLSYAMKPNTVLRAAYGLMFDTNSAPAVYLNQQGFSTQTVLQSTNGGVSSAFNWNSGFPPVPQGPDLDPTFANGGSTSWMPLNGARLPQIENYNVGVQQKLWGGIVMDAAYVGTQGHHLYNGNLNPNQLSPNYLALGNTLASNIGSAQAIAAGITAPYPGFVGTVAQALRPYPQYQTITYSNDPIGNEIYNSLQVRGERTLSHGLALLVVFTWAKNYTDVNSVGAQNYYDYKAEKAVASYDLPRSFVAGYTYDLPVGQGKILNLSNSVANRILGGWTTSGVLTLQAGMPISVTTELSLPAIGAILPDVVPGVPLYGANHTRGSFNPRVDTYLNINGFTAPPPYSFGDAPRYFNQVRAFGYKDWDVALMKKIALTDHVSFSLKGEFFNALNTVNFAAPNSDINSPSFGTITTITNNPRNGQVSGTFSF